MRGHKGLTLVEILVVMAISSYIVANLLTNILKSKYYFQETVRIMVSDLRKAQADSLSSKQFNNLYRCGYGLHMLTASQASTDKPFGRSYYIYTLKNPPPTCGNYTYQPSDSDVVDSRVFDDRLEICGPPTGPDNCDQTGNFSRFGDTFFESPHGDVYINNKTCPASTSQSKSQIIIRQKGVPLSSCTPLSCAYICVYASGKIESRTDPCPDMAC